MKRTTLFFFMLFILCIAFYFYFIASSVYAIESITVTTTHTFSKPGTHTISVIAWDEAGNSDEDSVTVIVLCYPTLSASLSPTSIIAGKTATLSGRLYSPELSIQPRQQIRFQYLYRGVWKNAAYVYTDAQGYYRCVAKPKTTTTYRAYYNGDGGAIKSAKSRNVTLKVVPPTPNIAAAITLALASVAALGAGAYSYNKKKVA